MEIIGNGLKPYKICIMRKMFYTERTLIKRNSKKDAISIRAMIRESVEILFGILTMLHFLLWHSFEYILWHFFSGFIDITYFMYSCPC